MGSVDVNVKPLDVTVDKVGAVGPLSFAPDPIHIDIDNVNIQKITIAVDPVQLTIEPLDLSLEIKEFPSIRGHLPADFSVGISMLGMELLCLRLCGEAQIITEPYKPNPCEICGGVKADDKGHGTHG